MNTTWQIYWLTRLDNLLTLFTVLLVLIVIGNIFYFIFRGVECYDQEDRNEFNKQWKGIKVTWFIAPVLALLVTMLPSKADMITIIVGAKVIDFAKSDTSIQKIPSQSTKIISDFLQGEIDKVKTKE